MRQIYASPRLENVERVAQLLGESGVETWISNGRSYKGRNRRNFSFRDHAQEPSAVWLVQPKDLSRATAILREAGLLTTTRDRNFVPSAGRLNHPDQRSRPASTAVRVRLVLLVVLGLMAAMMAWQLF
ncbi:hypothetical protein [Pseudomarimonas salicorniae]|uniref:Signal transducing protein n=1 Tax=Pseudomarimonas salicorniae TaxID=2933270 RepID=A0ABT0GI50_9GAMM|nr:hypothetical protein [Lysobacter sp. CAU 1642]MCK7593849.1 hypothetical protein [Lysobacter sp. CAU 1642]